MVKEHNSTVNLVALDSKIWVYFKKNPTLKSGKLNTKHFTEIPFIKYSIKETDMRVKTASFTTPVALDLTAELVIVKIISKFHENFTGIVLSDEFTENSDGTYTYQCQDMSREYQTKISGVYAGDVSVYRILQNLMTYCNIPLTGKVSSKIKKGWKDVLSGLRPVDLYEQSLWGNHLKMNSMRYKPKMIIRNKSIMETIRDLTIGYMRYIDVYFDDYGLLKVEPFSVNDWMNTGLVVTTDESLERNFKFDTTNAITGGIVESTVSNKTGIAYSSDVVTGLNLSAFFGTLNDSTSNPNQGMTSTGSKGKSTTKKTVTKNQGNPYGTKKKKIWIGADGGSGGFCKQIIKQLKKNGWTVHYSGEGPNVHYTDYFNVTKDYQVLAIVDNGFDPATVKEAYEGTVKNTLAKKKVTCMFFFDSRAWTDPHGMKPYRYGNFKNMKIGRAWDDNYSSFHGTLNVCQYFKKNNIKYCCNPTAAGIAKQFLAGGLTCK